MTQPNKSRETLTNLQTIRFLAALWVFLLHFHGTPIFPNNNNLLDSIINMGFAGVDIFFVISGYIMALTLKNVEPGFSSSWKFMSKRLTRIYSGWWPLFFCYLLLYSKFQPTPPDVHLLGSFFLAPLYLQQYLVSVTWTLSFELYFYACLAALLIFTRKLIVFALLLAAATIMIYGVFSYSQGIYTPQGVVNANRLQNFYAYVLILEFIAGYSIAHIRRFNDKSLIIASAIGFLILISCAYVYQNNGNLYPSGLAGFYHAPERVFLIGGAACCLIFFADKIEQRGITSAPWLQDLGNASYALYLIHILAINVINMIAPTILSMVPSKAHFSLPLLFILIIIVSSTLFHRYIELPINRSLLILFAHPREKPRTL